MSPFAPSLPPQEPAPAFGLALRRWRGLRRISQLELSLRAGVSARHISFLETGRSRPSREMVSDLAFALDAPREGVNELLLAAGFAPLYRNRGLSDEGVAAALAVIEAMLARHAPDPAIAVDRLWRITALNPAAAALFGALGMGVGASLVDALSDPASPMRAALQNWEALAPHFHARLRTELAALGEEPALAEACARIEQEPGFAHLPKSPPSAVIPAVLKVGEHALSLLSVVAQLGATNDLALADLRVELFFAADAESQALLATLCAHAHAPGD